MKKRLQTLFLGASWCYLSLSSFSVHAAEAALISQKPTLPYEQVGFAQFKYSSFLKPWNDKAHPLFYAVISDSTQFSQYFHPAYVMGTQQAAAPNPEEWKQFYWVVIARIVSPSSQKEPLFEVTNWVQKGTDLEIQYRYTPATRPSSYTATDGLILKIPRTAHFETIRLVENTRPVGHLQPQKGQMSMNTPQPMIIPPPKDHP